MNQLEGSVEVEIILLFSNFRVMLGLFRIIEFYTSEPVLVKMEYQRGGITFVLEVCTLHIQLSCNLLNDFSNVISKS